MRIEQSSGAAERSCEYKQSTEGGNCMKSAHSIHKHKTPSDEIGSEQALRANERADERMAQYSPRRFNNLSTHRAAPQPDGALTLQTEKEIDRKP